MGTYISKNLNKTSVTIDKYGKIISKVTSTSAADEMKQKQELRAQRLGMRRR